MSMWFCLCVCHHKRTLIVDWKTWTSNKEKKNEKGKKDRMKLQWTKSHESWKSQGATLQFHVESTRHSGRLSNMPRKNEEIVAMSVKWMKHTTSGEFLKRIHCHIWHHTNVFNWRCPTFIIPSGWYYTQSSWCFVCVCLKKK